MLIDTDKMYAWSGSRYVAVQADCASNDHVAIKTENRGDEQSTWVYLTKTDAMRLAAEILQMAQTID